MSARDLEACIRRIVREEVRRALQEAGRPSKPAPKCHAELLPPVARFIADVERASDALEMAPRDALTAAGVHNTNWYRWKSGSFSPNARTMHLVREKLRELAGRQEAA